MARGSSAALSRDIQALFQGGTAVGFSDRQLLDRFADGRDPAGEAAFEALVRRHGPMIWRVCRRAELPDPNDAHDAFQATFLVLARRSGSLRRLDSLGGWLYGVACRVSARARVEAARRRAVEGRAALRVVEAVEPPGADADLDSDEFGPIIREEVRRLPEKYRAVVVLCYWEGLTQEQAAVQLGCPLGTVRSRLARARDLLRRRLTRRGVAPTAGLAASGLDFAPIAPIPAGVPDLWVAATVRAASSLVSGGGPAPAVAIPATVAILVRDALRRMFMMKVKTTAIALSLIGLGAAGAILAAPQSRPNRPEREATTAGRPEPDRRPSRAAPTAARGKIQPPLQSLEEYVIEPPDLLIVEVLEALPGRPISGERLVRPDGKISLGFYGEVYVAGLSIMEAKEKIVLHLRKYVADRILGLTEGDGDRDIEGTIPPEKLRATDRVFVDVTAYNSKNYYVQGQVQLPGRFVVTGHETVLDALNLAGGLMPGADHRNVILYRMGKDGALQRLPIDIDQITIGDDPTTNYQLMPGDRLVIPAELGRDSGESPPLEVRPSTPRRKVPEGPRRADRPAPAVREQPRDIRAPRREAGAENRSSLGSIERRLDDVERKLDRILDALDRLEK